MSSDRSSHERFRSRRLYAYECRGASLPTHEPAHPGFLGIWSEPPYYYLFFSEPALAFVGEWVRDKVDWSLEGHYDLDYDQWQQVPRTEQRVGPFVITLHEHQPDPHAPEATGHELPIRLDPGVVFGSGLHPTSRGSLLAIAHWVTSRCVRTAVDFGTGTGILAIACARCGAERILAVDCNPLAVRAALRNAARNGLDGRVSGLAASTLDVVRAPTDLLVMNIEWPSLLQVFREGAWASHSAVIVSGFLKHCEEEVRNRLAAGGPFRVTWRHEEDGWPTLIASV